MSAQVILVFILTFIIHLVSTLSYALRIAGVRTGRIAVSLALFNVLVLLSRTSHTFQGPLLAKHVERNILGEGHSNIATDLRWLVFASTLATVVGIILIPTFQQLFTRAIHSFGEYRSVPRLLLRGFSFSAFRELKTAARLPKSANVGLISLRGAPRSILLFNIVATALITVGVFASLYAGYLQPELRVTANNLSPVINGLSTILLFVFIDPYLSLLTDDVVAGRETEAFFRRCVVLFAVSRLIGTLVAQLLLVPAAKLIRIVSEII